MVSARQKEYILYSILVAVSIFVLPINLFLKFGEHSAYVRGLFVDYLLGKLYLFDIVVVVTLGVWLTRHWRALAQSVTQWQPRHQLWSLLSLSFVIFVVLRQVFTPLPLVGLWTVGRYVLVGIWGIWLSKHTPHLNRQVILGALALTIVFQSALGWYQYALQKNFAPYWLLGETRFSQPFGLATSSWGRGGEQALAYGSTAHPNILAGVLLIYTVLWWQLSRQQQQSKKLLGGVVVSLLFGSVLWITESGSALLAAVCVAMWAVLPSTQWRRALGWSALAAFLLIPVALTIANRSLIHPSLDRRVILNQAAIDLWIKHPLTGVGLSHFTWQLEAVAPSREVARFLQPAHHVGLLWLAETGLVGLGVVVSLGWLWWRHQRSSHHYFLANLCLLLPLASLDHYLLTQMSGVAALVLLFAFMSSSTPQRPL